MDIIDARIGRQLIIDDYLLDQRSLARKWLPPIPHAENPVLAPTTDRDMNGGRCPVAAPFDDGILYDPDKEEWRVWYMSGWFCELDSPQRRATPRGQRQHSPKHSLVFSGWRGWLARSGLLHSD